MALQSNEEMLRTADEWIRNFRPSNLVPSTKNAELILTECLNKHGIISISGMTEASQAIADDLELYPEAPQPKVKTHDELAAEENLRQFKDLMESRKPQPSFEEKVGLIRRSAKPTTR